MNRRVLRALFVTAGLALAAAAPALAAPLDSDITYQGELNLNGNPVNNTADFRFRLFDALAAGNAESGLIAVNNVQVVEGVFTASIDFGFDVFQDDEQLFMEIQVRSPAGAGVFATLTPRQAITPSPFAVAARRGFVPWIVRTPGSTNAITLDPNNAGALLQVARANVDIARLEQSGAGGGGVFRALNEDTGNPTAFWGTAFNDQSGVAGLFDKDSGFFFPVLIDADADENGANGIFEGLIQLRSRGIGGTGGRLVVQNNDSIDTLEARGGVSGDGAELNLFDPATSNSVLTLRHNTIATTGGQIRTFSETGDSQFILEPDFDTNGGAFFFMDSGTVGGNAFIVDGNFGNSGSPGLSLTGTSDFSVDCSTTGNASVILPGNAVASGEILDEPGVANAQDGSVSLTTTVSSILSRSITVPDDGFVIAFAQGDAQIAHVSGGDSFVQWGVNDVAGVIPVNGDILMFLPSGAATGTYAGPTSAHALFAVTAGTHTFHFNAEESGAEATIFDLQLTLLYVPTRYGLVDPSVALSGLRGNGDDAPPFMPLTAQEIAAERAQGEALGQLRVQQELAELKAEVEAMKAMMRSNPNMQPQAAPAPRSAPVIHGDQFGPAVRQPEAAEPVVEAAPATDAPAAE